MILAPLQKLPKNVEDLGKLIVAKGSGHTVQDTHLFVSLSLSLFCVVPFFIKLIFENPKQHKFVATNFWVKGSIVKR